jgi:glucose-1-phosphate thymidylyltransferase
MNADGMRGHGVVAVVLAAGRGTRMQRAAPVPLTGEQSVAAALGLKMLVPINGRPFLAYVLDEVAAAGFEEACVVVGPDRAGSRDAVRAAAESLATTLHLRFAVQAEPKGGADAVLAAEPSIGGAPFIVINADNIYPAKVLRRLRELDGPGLAAFDAGVLVRESNIPADRLTSFALVRANGGWLAEIVEKPAAAALSFADAAVSMTCWRFDRTIFDACRGITPSPRGELELPDAVTLALRRGVRFRVVPVSAGVLDLSNRDDIPVVERMLRRAAAAGR